MYDNSYFPDAEVLQVLARACAELTYLGIPCLIAPCSLEQGESISLYVGGSELAVHAAAAAQIHGAAFAHMNSLSFAEDVAAFSATYAIQRAAFFGGNS